MRCEWFRQLRSYRRELGSNSLPVDPPSTSVSGVTGRPGVDADAGADADAEADPDAPELAGVEADAPNHSGPRSTASVNDESCLASSVRFVVVS